MPDLCRGTLVWGSAVGLWPEFLEFCRGALVWNSLALPWVSGLTCLEKFLPFSENMETFSLTPGILTHFSRKSLLKQRKTGTNMGLDSYRPTEDASAILIG